MNLTITFATALRVLRQLKGDPRTVVMILLLPALLLTVLYFLYHDRPEPVGPRLFNGIAVVLLAILPFAVMFLLTSIAMQRERSSGTLERLMTTPLAKADLLFGYGIAFSVAAAAQAVVTASLAFLALGVTVNGSAVWVFVVAVVDAMLGVALGLLASAFARTEFQAVQFMPLIVIPQVFLGGLLVAREDMPRWLHIISDVLPLSYAIDAIKAVASSPTLDHTFWINLGVVTACVILALAVASATLRRRTV